MAERMGRKKVGRETGRKAWVCVSEDQGGYHFIHTDAITLENMIENVKIVYKRRESCLGEGPLVLFNQRLVCRSPH